MSLSYTGVGTANSGNNGTPDPVAPATVDAGDLLVAVIGWRGSTTISLTGWTHITGSPFSSSSGINQIHILWKIADGTEDGAIITFNKSGGGTGQTYNSFIFGVSGAHQTTPINVIGTASENASAADIGPISGITPTTAGSYVVVVGHRADDWTSVDTLSGDSLTWAEIAEEASQLGQDGGTVADYATGWTSGSISDKTFTVTGGANNTGYGVMFAIQPSSTANSVTHTAPNFQLNGGTHARTTGHSHTAPNLQLAGGTHTAAKSKLVTHVAPNLQLVGGTHSLSSGRSHTAVNLQLNGGTHTTTHVPFGPANYTVTHVSPNLQFAGGTHELTAPAVPTRSAANPATPSTEYASVEYRDVTFVMSMEGAPPPMPDPLANVRTALRRVLNR